MRNTGKRAATVVALSAATAVSAATMAFASEPAATTADEWETVTTQADVDGDGSPNAVTLREVSADTQTLTFAFAEEVIDTSFEADARPPLQQPRVVDIDGDGRDEIMVAQSVGANTITFNIWKYEPGQGIVRLTTSAGAPFEVYEGGGVASISGYSCNQVPGGREFVTVNSHTSSTEPVFDGDRITYSVNLNAMTVEARAEIREAPVGDPLLATDPASCTP